MEFKSGNHDSPKHKKEVHVRLVYSIQKNQKECMVT